MMNNPLLRVPAEENNTAPSALPGVAAAPPAAPVASGAQQPQGGAPNPLAALALIAQAKAAQEQAAPKLTHEQVVAAMHRFGAVERQMKKVMASPEFGKANIRPKLFDAAADLLGMRVLTLPELMNAIKNLPPDPTQQKAFVENIHNNARAAQMKVLGDYRQATLGAEPEAADFKSGWSDDTHGDHFASMMGQYKGSGNG